MSRLGLDYGIADGEWHIDNPYTRQKAPMPETKITDSHVMNFINALANECSMIGMRVDHTTDSLVLAGLHITRHKVKAALKAAMEGVPRLRTDAELRAAIDAEGPCGFIRVTTEELDRIRQWPTPQSILHHHRRKDDPK